jgi:hypothetical protein
MGWTRFIYLTVSIKLFASCGSLTTEETSSFTLRMVGTYSVPPGATGDDAPQSQTFSFTSLLIHKSDGTSVELFNDTAQKFKIIDRPQMIYKNTDMSAYDGTVFTRATVIFSPDVNVVTKAGNQFTLTLDPTSFDLGELFTITQGKAQVLTLKANWGQTVTENDDGSESISIPGFTMIYTED